MRLFKIINQCTRHFIVITRHRWFVMVECFKRGLYWQGLIHDLSKYSPAEFIQSARYFQGDKTPIEQSKAILGYSTAWLHHKGRNKHHWEYWVDWYNGIPASCEIPKKYLIEMACDMIGASKAYLKGNYNRLESLAYFNTHCDRWLMYDKNKDFIRSILRENAKI